MSDKPHQLEMPAKALPLEQLTVAMIGVRAAQAADSIAACRQIAMPSSPQFAMFAKTAPTHPELLARVAAEHAERLPQPKPTDRLVRGGMLVHDALFADYLEALGGAGPDIAKQIREQSRQRLLGATDTRELFTIGLWQIPAGLCDAALWWLWDTGPRGSVAPAWLTLLGGVLWTGDAGEILRRKQRPAMALPFAEDTAMMRRALVIEGQLLDEQGELSPLVPIGPAQLDALAQQGLESLDTPTADRLFGWLLRLGFELHAADPLKPVHMYAKEIVGGYRAIAAELGVRGGKAANEIAALLAALNRCCLSWDVPGLSRGQPLPLVHLMTTKQHHCRPGRQQSFSLGLSPLWTPGLCHLLTGSDRLIVPWLDLPTLEPIHNRHHRAAVRLWREVRLALRIQAHELHHGGVRLDWQTLALTAELPTAQLPVLLDAWTTETGPLEIAGDRVTPRDPMVRAMLLDGADRQSLQRERGRRGADRRWKKGKKAEDKR
jgi:hypothetical protein